MRWGGSQPCVSFQSLTSCWHFVRSSPDCCLKVRTASSNCCVSSFSLRCWSARAVFNLANVAASFSSKALRIAPCWSQPRFLQLETDHWPPTVVRARRSRLIVNVLNHLGVRVLPGLLETVRLPKNAVQVSAYIHSTSYTACLARVRLSDMLDGSMDRSNPLDNFWKRILVVKYELMFTTARLDKTCLKIDLFPMGSN